MFIGDLEGAGAKVPCTQPTFKSPTLLELTTQNLPKTDDDHQEQLVLGLGYQF